MLSCREHAPPKLYAKLLVSLGWTSRGSRATTSAWRAPQPWSLSLVPVKPSKSEALAEWRMAEEKYRELHR